MKLFYCNKCERDVILTKGKCPLCNTNWEKLINESETDEDALPFGEKDVYYHKGNFKDETDDITYNDIRNNINFFLRWASIVEIFLMIVGLLAVLFGIIQLEQTDGVSIFYIVTGIGVIGEGFIFANSLRWKAYMLYTSASKDKKNF